MYNFAKQIICNGYEMERNFSLFHTINITAILSFLIIVNLKFLYS